MCSQSSNSAKAAALSPRARLHSLRKRGGALCRVQIYISYKARSHKVNGSGKVIVDPHPDPHQRQKLNTSARAYTMFGRRRQLMRSWVMLLTDRTNDSVTNDHITPPALAALWPEYNQLYFTKKQIAHNKTTKTKILIDSYYTK